MFFKTAGNSCRGEGGRGAILANGADSSLHRYTPPISHYCAGNNDGGGGAIIADAVLPHAPYANPKGAIITAMHGGLWCSFAYKVRLAQ